MINFVSSSGVFRTWSPAVRRLSYMSWQASIRPYQPREKPHLGEDNFGHVRVTMSMVMHSRAPLTASMYMIGCHAILL